MEDEHTVAGYDVCINGVLWGKVGIGAIGRGQGKAKSNLLQ